MKPYGLVFGTSLQASLQVNSPCVRLSIINKDTVQTVAQALVHKAPLVARIARRIGVSGDDARCLDAFAQAALELAGKGACGTEVEISCNGYDRASQDEALTVLPRAFRIMGTKPPTPGPEDFAEILAENPLPEGVSGTAPRDPAEKKVWSTAVKAHMQSLGPAIKEWQWQRAEEIAEQEAASDSRVCDLPPQIVEQIVPIVFGGESRGTLYWVRDAPAMQAVADRGDRSVFSFRKTVARLDWSAVMRDGEWRTLWEAGRLRMSWRDRDGNETWLFLSERAAKFAARDATVFGDEKQPAGEKLRCPPFGSAKTLLVVIMPPGFLEWPDEKRAGVRLTMVRLPTNMFPDLFRAWVQLHAVNHLVASSFAQQWTNRALDPAKAGEIQAAKALGHQPNLPTVPLLPPPPKPRASDTAAAPPPPPREKEPPPADTSDVRAAAARAASN